MVTGNNPRGQQAVRISAAFSVVGNLIVLCRLYIRFIMIKSPGAEDLCIAVAMLFSTAFTVLVKVQADAGLGIHAWELTNDELLRPLKVGLIILLELICTELYSLFFPVLSAIISPLPSPRPRSFFNTTEYFQKAEYEMRSTFSGLSSLRTASRPSWPQYFYASPFKNFGSPPFQDHAPTNEYCGSQTLLFTSLLTLPLLFSLCLSSKTSTSHPNKSVP